MYQLRREEQAQNFFKVCKCSVAHASTLSHRDLEQGLCNYTDGSEDTWSGIATQISGNDWNMSHAKRRRTSSAFFLVVSRPLSSAETANLVSYNTGTEPEKKKKNLPSSPLSSF